MMTVHSSSNDDVTIVMITHNRCDEITRSLVEHQALPEQPCIIVVDNASTDDTVSIVRTKFPDVTVIQAKKNLGAAGRNLGVEQATTPYVAFSDDDTWWAAGSLALAVDILNRHPDVAVLNASIVVGPERRPDPACIEMADSPLPVIDGIGPMLTGFMAGACVMRPDVFRKAGGYWPAFFIGSEETLLSMDILDAGHKIAYAPALTVHHWPSKRRNTPQRIMLTERNAVWCAWMRLPQHIAWARTRSSLRATSSMAQRIALAVRIVVGLPTVMANRRVLKADTIALLQRVWQHESRPH